MKGTLGPLQAFPKGTSLSEPSVQRMSQNRAGSTLVGIHSRQLSPVAIPEVLQEPSHRQRMPGQVRFPGVSRVGCWRERESQTPPRQSEHSWQGPESCKNQFKPNGIPLQYSCLENSMDGGAWQAAVHGVTELDTTEQLHFDFSLSCIGKGNGNPLQCSCLENPRDGGAWWAAIYGVAQSWTRLKQLSSSSNVV